MQHCVGSYTEACFRGNCLIYSVAQKNTHIGTMEMIKDARGLWRAVQFKGLNNRNLMHTVRNGNAFQFGYAAFTKELNQTWIPLS